MSFSRTIAALAVCSIHAAAQTVEIPRPGTQLTYAVQYVTHGSVDLAQAVVESAKSPNVSAKSEMQSSVTGTETVTFLNLPGRGPVAAVRILKPAVQVELNRVQQVQMQNVTAADLEKTVYVYLDAGGRLERTEFPGGYSAIARNLMGGLLAAQQFGLPPAGRYAASWQTSENSPQAVYQARYTLLADAGGLKRVTKTVSPATNGAAPQRTARSGKLDYSIEPSNGVVKLVSGNLREEIFVQNRKSGANDITVKSQLVSSRELTASALVAARSTFQSNKVGLKSAADADAAEIGEGKVAIEKQILGTDTAVTLRQALPLLDGSGAGTEQRTALYLKLRALFILTPAEAAGFAKLAVDPSKSSTGVITGALSTAGTEESQAALCAIVESHKNDAAASAALVPELGSVEKPSEKLIAYLTQFSRTTSFDGARGAALMALGTAAGKIVRSSPQRADRIVEDLKLRWSPMKGGNTVLLALGNTQSPNAEKFILSQKSDTSPMIRRAVAKSLSGFPSSESGEALVAYLGKDLDPSVRAAAAQSLAPRHSQVPVREVLLRAVQYDKMEVVRVAAMFSLSASIAGDDNVRAILTKIAKSDSSEPIRGQAAQLLEQARNALAK